jgi:hypothetical protein
VFVKRGDARPFLLGPHGLFVFAFLGFITHASKMERCWEI